MERTASGRGVQVWWLVYLPLQEPKAQFYWRFVLRGIFFLLFFKKGYKGGNKIKSKSYEHRMQRANMHIDSPIVKDNSWIAHVQSTYN